jgi:hypothetical protein
MTYREASRGAAIAGAVLVGLPVIELLYGPGTPGPVHLVIGVFGLALLGVSGRLR